MAAFDHILKIRCFAEQKDAWAAAARYEGMDVSTWVRHLLDREMQLYEEIVDLPDPAAVLLGKS